jgi:hypothetical protein
MLTNVILRNSKEIRRIEPSGTAGQQFPNNATDPS